MSDSRPSASALTPPARARARRIRLSSLEALECGTALFRSTFADEAWRYYLGAAPLVICLIPIWAANGQMQLSTTVLLAEALLLTAAFWLRIWMTSRYVQRVRERAFGTPVMQGATRLERAAMAGRLLAWKTLLCVAVLLALPTVAGASWLYSACQFASLEAQGEGTERHSLAGCVGLANQWFGGSLLLLVMMLPLWGTVWLNGFILALVLPELLHSLFGVNTLLSTVMGMRALTESSAFWLSLFAVAWLVLDPIVKCTYVIVYRHLRSRREGDDLRELLSSLPREQGKKAQRMAPSAMRTGAMLVLASMLLGVPLTTGTGVAQTVSAPGAAAAQLPQGTEREAQVQQLRQALQQESQRAIYRWHDAEHPSPPNWLERQMAKLGERLDRIWNALRKLLRKLWPAGLNLSASDGKSHTFFFKQLRTWLVLLGALTITAAALLWWMRRRRTTEVIPISPETVVLPDFSNTAVATERSEEEWFSLANQLQAAGELRLALRAAYLGLLAGLAQREWLTIRRDRTNREYLGEFTRRWRRRPQAAVAARAEIPERLRGSLRQFDRVWYGLHGVTAESVTAYRQDLEEFLRHV